MVVYIEPLVLVNLVMNTLALAASAAVLRRRPAWWRLLLGAAAGTAWSVLLYIVPWRWPGCLAARLIVTMLLVLLVFGRRAFLRALLALAAASGGLAGVMFGLAELFGSRHFLVKNGIPYLDIPPLCLLLLGAAAFLAVAVSYRLAARRRSRGDYVTLRIVFREKERSCRAIIDTGNTLTEPLSGYPVIVLEKCAARELLPDEAAGFCENAASPPPPETCYRVVPCRTVAGLTLLPAFFPDQAVLRKNSSEVSLAPCWAAVSAVPLCAEGQVEALLFAGAGEIKEGGEPDACMSAQKKR